MRLWDKELKAIEKPIIDKCFAEYNNSINAVSQSLLISRSKLYKLIDRYEIKVNGSDGRYKPKNISTKSLFIQTKTSVKKMIEKHYKLCGFDQIKTANKLGLSRTTMMKYMNRYGIETIDMRTGEKFFNWMPTEKKRMRLWDIEIMKIEKPIMERFIKKHDYNIHRTCADLGMNRGTFENRVDLYGIKLIPNESCKYSQIETGFEMRRLSKPKIKSMLIKYLKKNRFNITQTAKELQISTKKLRNFIDMTGIDKDEYI